MPQTETPSSNSLIRCGNAAVQRDVNESVAYMIEATCTKEQPKRLGLTEKGVVTVFTSLSKKTVGGLPFTLETVIKHLHGQGRQIISLQVISNLTNEQILAMPFFNFNS